jgi:acyl dehydratase
MQRLQLHQQNPPRRSDSQLCAATDVGSARLLDTGLSIAQNGRKTAANGTIKEQDMSGITPAELASRVGESIGTSEWILVDQDMINKFADATGDHQFIHVNEEMAKMTPFGGTIAHGFLTLSLFPVMSAKSDCPKVEGVKMGVNYGGNKTRFLSPVRSGKRVRGNFKLLELVEKRPGQWQQTLEFSVEIEGEEKPALTAEWISQFFV